MTKLQYYQLKNYHKTVAEEIKPAKQTLREQQSFVAKNQAEEFSSVRGYLMKRIERNQKDLIENRKLFRCLHIVYCIARGKTYKQIENRVRKGNELDIEEMKYYFKRAGVEMPENFEAEIKNVELVA